MIDPQRILVVGSVALDTIRTPYGEVTEALGGSASYFSFSASHFAPVSVVAVVGEDFPVPHRDLFLERGVDLAGLETAAGRTFRWRGEYAADLGHAHTLETQLNVFAEFHPRLGPEHRRAPYVFLANIAPDLQFHFLNGAGVEAGIAPVPSGNGCTMNSYFLRPQSRGSVTLRSSDPLAKPVIDTNYLAEPGDIKASVEGMRVSREIMAQASFKPFIKAEHLPGQLPAGGLEHKGWQLNLVGMRGAGRQRDGVCHYFSYEPRRQQSVGSNSVASHQNASQGSFRSDADPGESRLCNSSGCGSFH